MMYDKQYLHNFYNATSTSDQKDTLETYESWLERQLISRLKKIDELESKMAFALENVEGMNKSNFGSLKRTVKSILGKKSHGVRQKFNSSNNLDSEWNHSRLFNL